MSIQNVSVKLAYYFSINMKEIMSHIISYWMTVMLIIKATIPT